MSKAFREYFEKLNKSFLSHPIDAPAPPRKPITAEIVHVCELKATLDPQAEVDVVQKAINRHNDAMMNGGPTAHVAHRKRLKLVDNFLYFAYLISQIDSARLISLCNVPPHLIDSGEVRFMASSILIAPFYPKKELLDKVGGRGKRVTWQVSGIAKFEDRIWAARVAPVSETQEKIHTQDPTPCVVLAIRKGSRPIDVARISNWVPVASDKAFMFETTVGDKVMLRLEEEDLPRNNQGGRGKQRDNGFKRKFDDTDARSKENWPKPGERDDGSWAPKSKQSDRHGQGRYFNQSKASFNNKDNGPPAGGQRRGQQNGSGGQQQNRNRNVTGGSTGGGRRNRGGNRGPAYKSLDDYGPAGFDGPSDSKGQGPNEMVMNY